jgi:hypothetical protein
VTLASQIRETLELVHCPPHVCLACGEFVLDGEVAVACCVDCELPAHQHQSIYQQYLLHVYCPECCQGDTLVERPLVLA